MFGTLCQSSDLFVAGLGVTYGDPEFTRIAPFRWLSGDLFDARGECSRASRLARIQQDLRVINPIDEISRLEFDRLSAGSDSLIAGFRAGG